MNKLQLIFLSLTFSVLSVTSLCAQKSALDTTMVIYNPGNYKPTVADANKINSEPVVTDSTKKIPVKSYIINSKKINPTTVIEPVSAAEMEGEPLTKLYNALVKAGMGTYTTPYLEFWYNSLRSKEYAYGVRLKHISSAATLKNYGYAGMSDNQVSLYGKKFLKEHSLIGNFDFDIVVCVFDLLCVQVCQYGVGCFIVMYVEVVVVCVDCMLWLCVYGIDRTGP